MKVAEYEEEIDRLNVELQGKELQLACKVEGITTAKHALEKSEAEKRDLEQLLKERPLRSPSSQFSPDKQVERLKAELSRLRVESGEQIGNLQGDLARSAQINSHTLRESGLLREEVARLRLMLGNVPLGNCGESP